MIGKTIFTFHIQEEVSRNEKQTVRSIQGNT